MEPSRSPGKQVSNMSRIIQVGEAPVSERTPTPESGSMELRDMQPENQTQNPPDGQVSISPQVPPGSRSGSISVSSRPVTAASLSDITMKKDEDYPRDTTIFGSGTDLIHKFISSKPPAFTGMPHQTAYPGAACPAYMPSTPPPAYDEGSRQSPNTTLRKNIFAKRKKIFLAVGIGILIFVIIGLVCGLVLQPEPGN